MARQRFIWPDLWTDPGFGRLAQLEQVIYIGCFSNADDDGRLLGAPEYLKTTIVPYAKVSLRIVHRARDSIVAAMPKLVLYESSAVEYLAFVNWREWQKPKYPKPSRFPAPTSEALGERLPEPLAEPFRESLGEPSGNDSAVGRDGLGRDRDEAKASSANGHKPRRRDELFDAVVVAVGIDASSLTESGRGALNRALKELRLAGAVPGEVRARAGEFRCRYSVPLTASALSKHWASLGRSSQPVSIANEHERRRREAADELALPPAENARRMRELQAQRGSA